MGRIDFDSLFPGFRRYRFALYTDETVCLDGEVRAWDERFRGNTSLLFEGEYIAIWNVGADPIEDMDMLACSLAHEMFHCHQNTLGESRFPSDLTLLNYPEDAENFALKYQENCFLADAYEHSDAEAFGRFAAIRNRRFEKYPRMVREELKTETLEGVAEYISLKALESLSEDKFREKVRDYLKRIRSESELQFDIRRISYYTGTVFYLCLDRLGYGVRNEIGSELTVYEQNPVPEAEEIPLRSCEFIETAYARLAGDRNRKIEEHIASERYTECGGEICGYDPMNMFRSGDLIYCSHFIMLRINGEVEMFPRKIVLQLKAGSDNEIKGYY